MASDSDVYRTANMLVPSYGEMAPVGAVIQADRRKEAGDASGRVLWLRVARATEELLSRKRPADAIVN